MWICFYVVCQLYNYDLPSLMETRIIEQFHVSNTWYSLMYSLYSMPNLVFPLFGGFFVDNFGAERVLIFSATMTVLGQSVVFFGAAQNCFTAMLVGRFIFGSGAELLLVLQFIDISRWFMESDYTLAIGYCQFVSISIALTSGYLSPRIAKSYGIAAAMGLGAAVASSSLVFVYFYIKLMKEFEPKYHK